MTTTSRPDLFLAFGGPDRADVRAIAVALRERGWEAFFDGDLDVGERWDLRLPDQLRSARVIAFLLPVDADSSPYLADEVRIALERLREHQIPVLPLRHIADPHQPARYGLGTFVHGDWDPANPGPAVDLLHRLLHRHLGQPGAATPPRPRRALTRGFVGREADLAAIADALLADEPTTVLLHGLGGIGKSTLAARFFELHQDRFPGGWAPVTLEPTRAPDADTLRAAIAVGAGAPKGADLALWLAHHRPLIHVENLDTADHLAAFAIVVRDLGVAVLGSSRRHLQGPWQTHEVRRLPADDALALLTARFRPPTPAEQQDADRLLSLVAGHPLAIEVVAAMLSREPERPWSRVWRALDQRGLRQPLGAGAIRDDHADVYILLLAELDAFDAYLLAEFPTRAAAWTNGLRALSALGAAGAGADLCAAVAGLPDEDDLLDLVREAGAFCLLERTDDPVRGRPGYAPHPLVCAVLAKQAGPEGKARLDGWMFERLEQSRWRELEAERAALAGWLDGLTAEEAVRACQSRLGPSVTAVPEAWLRAAERAIPIAAGNDLWHAFNAAASAAHWANRHRDCASHATAWAAAAEAASQSQELAQALRWASITSHRLGDADAAAKYLTSAASHASEGGHFSLALRCVVDSAHLSWSNGRYAEGLSTFDDGLLAWVHATGDAELLRWTLQVWCGLLVGTGDSARAVAIWDAGLAPLLSGSVAIRQATNRRARAEALRKSGRPAVALAELKDILPVTRATDAWQARIVLTEMARCLVALGRLDEAIGVLLDEVLPGARADEEPRQLAITLNDLGKGYAARNTPADRTAARAAWAEAEPLFRRIGDTSEADTIAARLHSLPD